MSYSQFETEHVRLSVLQVLNSDSDYETNEHILRHAAGALGLRVSQDAMRTQIAWLAEQNLITDRAVENTMVVKLTSRGRDVAEGVTLVPGVARPEPGN